MTYTLEIPSVIIKLLRKQLKLSNPTNPDDINVALLNLICGAVSSDMFHDTVKTLGTKKAIKQLNRELSCYMTEIEKELMRETKQTVQVSML